MVSSRRARRVLLASEIETALTERQPNLRITANEPELVLEGTFILWASEGPFDQYEVRIEVGLGFPTIEPKVWETGGRIPREIDRHINAAEGNCCLGVWEKWLVESVDTSFKAFLDGPVHDFFLSQWWFERTCKWRFGERSHGAPGMLEAYAEVLKVEPKQKSVLYLLRLLSKDWPKGHWLCPCGSGLILRKCHIEKFWRLHQRVPPRIAKHMLKQLTRQIAVKRAKVKRNSAMRIAA